MKHVFLLSLCVLLVACGGALPMAAPKVDTSTQETAKASMQKVRESLPADQQAEFDKAVETLMVSQMNLGEALAGVLAGKTPDQAAFDPAKLASVLNGKTGVEIIAEAKAVREKAQATATAQAAEAEAKRKAEALKEIADLEAKRAKADAAKAELAKFGVLSSRISKQQVGFLTQNVLDLTVKNGTTSPVSRVYFTGTLSSAGRSVPWLKAPFNYQIPGGLEPGEQATWKLTPNAGSDCYNVQAPDDAVLTLTVDRLDGKDGKVLFSATDFTDKDRERLDVLKKQYGQ